MKSLEFIFICAMKFNYGVTVYLLVIQMLSNRLLSSRLEVLNEKRSGVVQMVKLAEKERESLEVNFMIVAFVPCVDFAMQSRICYIYVAPSSGRQE